jgi:hypothetical protein
MSEQKRYTGPDPGVFVSSDDSPALLYVRGPHNSGKTMETFPMFWRAAKEQGFAGLYLMGSGLETEIVAKDYADGASASMQVTATTGLPTQAGVLTLADYAHFNDAMKHAGYLFKGYAKLIIFLDIPFVPSGDFEAAKGLMTKMLETTSDRVVKLVGFMTDGCTFRFPGDLEFPSRLECTMAAEKAWGDTSKYFELDSARHEMALHDTCIEALEKGNNVLCFLDRRSLRNAGMSFYARLATEALARLTGETCTKVECVKVDRSWTMEKHAVGQYPKLAWMDWNGSNRFQFEGRTSVIVVGVTQGWVPTLDPTTGMIALSAVKVSREEIAAQCGFADPRYTRVFRVVSDDDLSRLPAAPTSTAYNDGIYTTVLRMIETFPGKSYDLIPFDWAFTSSEMVLEVVRRLAAMGLVKDLRHGQTLTTKGLVALHVAKNLQDNIHAACLAAGAMVDPNLSPAAKRVILRLATIVAFPGLAKYESEYSIDQADKILGSCWGPGRRYSTMGCLWVTLGLWDNVRVCSNDFDGFDELDETIIPIADGTITLDKDMCLKALETLRSLETAAQLEPTNDLSAYDLDTTEAFYAVQGHLAASFFDRLCQAPLEADVGVPFHFVGDLSLEEKSRVSLVPLKALVGKLREGPLLSGEPWAYFFYQKIMRTAGGEYRFWNPTIVPEAALLDLYDWVQEQPSPHFKSTTLG